jgi:hypothetical protein
LLFLAEEANPACESAAVVVAEAQEAGGVDVVIDEGVVAAAGDVVEASTDRPVVAKGVEALFNVRVEREPCGEAVGAGGLGELELVVDDIEGEAGAKFAGVGEVEAAVERKQSPGKKTVRSIPRVGSGLL